MKSLVAHYDYEHNVATYPNSWPWLQKPSFIQKKCNLKSKKKLEYQVTTFNGYRYGFNGMERDDEWNGSGNAYDFGARIYDSRLGRWYAQDALKQFVGTQYSFAANNPVLLFDIDGNWVPGVDENGNIIFTSEEGDSYQDLIDNLGGRKAAKKYLNKAQWRHIKEMNETALNNKMAEGKIIYFNETNVFSKTMSFYIRNKDKIVGKNVYDCRELARTIVIEERAKTSLDKLGGATDTDGLFEHGRIYQNKVEVSKDELVFGETLTEWQFTGVAAIIGLSSGHAAIYFGTDKSGNEYFFSKNGETGELVIMSYSELDDEYNFWEDSRTDYKKKDDYDYSTDPEKTIIR